MNELTGISATVPARRCLRRSPGRSRYRRARARLAPSAAVPAGGRAGGLARRHRVPRRPRAADLGGGAFPPRGCLVVIGRMPSQERAAAMTGAVSCVKTIMIRGGRAWIRQIFSVILAHNEHSRITMGETSQCLPELFRSPRSLPRSCSLRRFKRRTCRPAVGSTSRIRSTRNQSIGPPPRCSRRRRSPRDRRRRVTTTAPTTSRPPSMAARTWMRPSTLPRARTPRTRFRSSS